MTALAPPRTLRRAARAPRRISSGLGRSARWIGGAARAHDASVARVALRAARLRARGWRLGDMALLGLLDPVGGADAERWALRRREFLRLQEALNPSDAVRMLEDKAWFAARCERLGLPAAPVALVLERVPGDAGTADAWAAALERGAPDELVVKPVEGALATGVRVLRRDAGGVAGRDGRRRTWAGLAAELAAEPAGGFLVQPRLRPEPGLRRLSGSDALQCLRVVTLLGDDGRARVLYTALRIAVGAAEVDSFRARWAGTTGNLLARVEEDGRLATPIGAAPGGFGLVRVARHPDTGAQLAGAPVPQAREALALALRAAEAFAPVRTVGWDVAPTADGPVVVEGNPWWGATADPDGALLPVRAALLEAVSGPAARPPRRRRSR
ncbi:sugar-transfer associated ATP-grasp domain-containing protein [Miltoncostaea marina]|uniref:sugar-transfer associated ATP-grasp domain-containing protein n=1 Tax=Miltoncostaea marina TaxID=2843215 RepID=UPI001C3CA142|nr:sugar-transfer associated ATP-grasp domain-containing protein [Miltoncostaea marina]